MTPAVVEPAGDLTIEPATADLGSVRQQQTLTGQYAVVNRLPVAVDIEMIGKSCSCAEAEIEPKTIEPGQTGTLSVAWRTATRRGKVAERVTVVAAARDGIGTKLIREMVSQADVRPDYRIEPPELRFDAKTGGTGVLELIPDAMPEVRVVNAVSSCSELIVLHSESSRKINISCFELAKNNPPARILVRTNSPYEPFFAVNVVLTGLPQESE